MSTCDPLSGLAVTPSVVSNMIVALPGFAPKGKVMYMVFDGLSISDSTPGNSFNENEVMAISGFSGSGVTGVEEPEGWHERAMKSIAAIENNLCIIKIKEPGGMSPPGSI